MRKIQINPGWCKGCGICVEFCPGRALGLDRICSQVSDLIVAELNDGQMKLEVERVTAGRCRIHHIGKVNGDIIRPGEICKVIQEVAG